MRRLLAIMFAVLLPLWQVPAQNIGAMQNLANVFTSSNTFNGPVLLPLLSPGCIGVAAGGLLFSSGCPVGTGTQGQVTVWGAGNTLTGSSAFTYNATLTNSAATFPAIITGVSSTSPYPGGICFPNSSGNQCIVGTNGAIAGNIRVPSVAGGIFAVSASSPLQLDLFGNLTCPSCGGIGGSGTLNKIPLWTPNGTTLENSNLSQNSGELIYNTGADSPSFAFTTTTADAQITCNNCSDAFAITNDYGGSVGSGNTAKIVMTSVGTNAGVLQLYAGNSSVLQLAGDATGLSNWVLLPGMPFASLAGASTAVGSVAYCNNCGENTNPCTTAGGTGTGTFAFKLSGKWKCL